MAGEETENNPPRLKHLKGKRTMPLSARTILDFNECRRVVNTAQTSQEAKLKENTAVQPLLNPLIPFAEYFIAAACDSEWKDMEGTEQFRTCQKCKLMVFDVKRMSLDDAKSLIFTREGKDAEAFYKRTDGTFLTSNCPIGVRNKKIKVQVYIGAFLVVVAVAIILGVIFAAGRVIDESASPSAQVKPASAKP